MGFSARRCRGQRKARWKFRSHAIGGPETGPGMATAARWRGAIPVGRDGFCVVENIDGHWIYKTVWSKKDFDEESETILEVLKNAGS